MPAKALIEFQQGVRRCGQRGGRNGAPKEIRTPDPQIRSLVLYPAELWVHITASKRRCWFSSHSSGALQR
jgi:hypothetical protein